MFSAAALWEACPASAGYITSVPHVYEPFNITVTLPSLRTLRDTKEASYKHYWCSVQLFAWYKVSLELKRNIAFPFIEVSWKVGIITWRVHPAFMAIESLHVKLRDPGLSLPIPWLLCGVRRLASATTASRREKKDKHKWMIAWFIRRLRKVRKIGLKMTALSVPYTGPIKYVLAKK